jgi:ribonuclease G
MEKAGASYIFHCERGYSGGGVPPDIDLASWENILKKKNGSRRRRCCTRIDRSFGRFGPVYQPVDRLIIDSKSEYERIRDFAATYLPNLSQRVELYDKDEPIFDYFEIEMEISKALGRKVWLKSGGYIVIDHAEALTVIDVNTGRYVGKRNQEETILKTNLEAVKEIAYQLRLRNIGGIIIIDFIDMDRGRNRESIRRRFKKRWPTTGHRPTCFAYRKAGRRGPGAVRRFLRVLCEPCSSCEGRWRSPKPERLSVEIFREIRGFFSRKEDHRRPSQRGGASL